MVYTRHTRTHIPPSEQSHIHGMNWQHTPRAVPAWSSQRLPTEMPAMLAEVTVAVTAAFRGRASARWFASLSSSSSRVESSRRFRSRLHIYVLPALFLAVGMLLEYH